MSGPLYTLEQAQALLPEARRQVERAAELVAELQRLGEQLRRGTAPEAAAADVAALQAAVEGTFHWFESQGVQIKSLEPALLDFPARAIRDGRPLEVLLCWRDDEQEIAYYHPPEGGYQLREPVAMLDEV
ncbi:MAG: DUF2203 domain-containing protein [Nitriliruptoraceae bacterium]